MLSYLFALECQFFSIFGKLPCEFIVNRGVIATKVGNGVSKNGACRIVCFKKR